MKEKKLFLFDIDGTLAIDQTLMNGTLELLSYIRELNGKAAYITNNSTKSRKDYVKKFEQWNIPVTEDDFVTASYASCLYLKENHINDKIFVVGTKSFVNELKDFGLYVTEEVCDDISVVIVGFDNELNYKKIQSVCEILSRENITYLATNPDLCCPTWFGSIPDCGAICKMIACATNRLPIYLGKPNPIIVNICIEKFGFTKEETLVVGDRLYTDIACGIHGGVDTAVVFTGEATPDDCKNTKYIPTYQFSSIKELFEFYRKLNIIHEFD